MYKSFVYSKKVLSLQYQNNQKKIYKMSTTKEFTSEGLTIKEYNGMIEYCNEALAHYSKKENAHHTYEIKEYKDSIAHYNKQIKAIKYNMSL